VPGIEDLTSDLEITSPQINVEIDRDKAASLGITASQIENAFYDAYGPRWVSTIYAAVNEYKVMLELGPEFQNDPSSLFAALLQGQWAARAAGDAGDRQTANRPADVNHYGQLTSATISFGLAPGAALGGVLSQVKDVADHALPRAVSGQFQGAAKAFQARSRTWPSCS